MPGRYSAAEKTSNSASSGDPPAPRRSRSTKVGRTVQAPPALSGELHGLNTTMGAFSIAMMRAVVLEMVKPEALVAAAPSGNLEPSIVVAESESSSKGCNSGSGSGVEEASSCQAGIPRADRKKSEMSVGKSVKKNRSKNRSKPYPSRCRGAYLAGVDAETADRLVAARMLPAYQGQDAEWYVEVFKAVATTKARSTPPPPPPSQKASV